MAYAYATPKDVENALDGTLDLEPHELALLAEVMWRRDLNPKCNSHLRYGLEAAGYDFNQFGLAMCDRECCAE